VSKDNRDGRECLGRMVEEADPQKPVKASRVNFDACQTYPTSKLGTRANASDQSARVSEEIEVLVCPSVRCFM